MTTAQKTKSAAEQWWLTLSNTGNVCESCRATIAAGGEFVFRKEPRGILCRGCADDDPAISYAMSGRWRRAQTAPEPEPIADPRGVVADAFRDGYEMGRIAARVEMQGRPQLPPELLERLIRLTHPDRHPAERAAEANAVTAHLLALRSDRGPR